MNGIFAIIPQFLKDPEEFFQSIQRGEALGRKALSLFISIVVFLALYGFVTGLSHSWLQGLSTAAKMPLLFLLTLAFTLPALYFFALALLNIRFSVTQAGVVVLSGIGVTAFLLLGLSPITLFFVLTSSNYAFFQLLAVGCVAVSGFTGLYYILRGFTWVDKARALTSGTIGGSLLRVWIIVYGFVGAQMTWRISPLIGDPDVPFVLLRPSRDNFFVDVIKAFQQAFGISQSSDTMDIGIIMFCGGLSIVIALALGLWWGSQQKTPSAQRTHQPMPQTTSSSPSTEVQKEQ